MKNFSDERDFSSQKKTIGNGDVYNLVVILND